MKIVIVGGVAGGASAAARARRLSEESEIILIERSSYISFANCGLPYYVGDQIKQREKLIVTTPQRLRERFRIDVRTDTNAVSINRSAKSLQLHNRLTNEYYEESYDKLILSPGASPVKPDFEGRDLPGVHSLRTLEDVDSIRGIVDGGAKEALVLGAGFIGLEVVENLVGRGVTTHLVQQSDQVLGTLDREMSQPIAWNLKSKGVDVHFGATVSKIELLPTRRLKVTLTSEAVLETDLVLLGIGVKPENQLALDAGLDTGIKGGIVTNSKMQTSDPDIYAVGDVVETEDFVLQRRTNIPLAGPANRQGRIAADHALGRKLKYRGTQGTSIVKVFDCVAASTGANERFLSGSGATFEKIYLHPANHAGYYPGAEGMSIKLLFETPTGKILGAQIVGGDGVDKRIDVIAMAIQAGLSVYDLEEVELAYAPQFGSAKDPINMAGFIASGVLRGDHPVTHWPQVQSESSALVIDVRTQEEFDKGHYPGAKHYSVDTLREQLSELPKDQLLTVYCQVGQRGYIASRILQQHGFRVRNVSGGYRSYLLFK